MTISAIHTEAIEKPIQNNRNKSANHGTLAILAALSIVREALIGNQLKMATSYDKFVSIRALIQDKLSNEFEKVLNLQKDAIDHMKITGIVMTAAMTLFLVSYAIPAAAAAKSLMLGIAKPLTSGLSAIGTTVGSGFQIEAGRIGLEIAEIESKNQTDRGLLSANEQISQDLADKVVQVVKTIAQSQEAITGIINAMGAAMQIASR